MNYIITPPRSGKTQQMFEAFKTKCEFYTEFYPQCNNPESFNQACDAKKCPLWIRNECEEK